MIHLSAASRKASGKALSFSCLRHPLSCNTPSPPQTPAKESNTAVEVAGWQIRTTCAANYNREIRQREKWKPKMADTLYLNLWWPSFSEAEMLARLECVLRQFPFSRERPGVGYFAVYGVSWSEPVLTQETFDYQVTPQQAVALAAEFLHDDNGYIFEAAWDLWSPGEQYDSWSEQPHPVKFLVHGLNFEDGVSEES